MNTFFTTQTSDVLVKDKARHEKMASLVERMLELTPLLSPQFQQTELGRRQAPRTPQDKERVRRVKDLTSVPSPKGDGCLLAKVNALRELQFEQLFMPAKKCLFDTCALGRMTT